MKGRKNRKKISINILHGLQGLRGELIRIEKIKRAGTGARIKNTGRQEYKKTKEACKGAKQVYRYEGMHVYKGATQGVAHEIKVKTKRGDRLVAPTG